MGKHPYREIGVGWPESFMREQVMPHGSRRNGRTGLAKKMYRASFSKCCHFCQAKLTLDTATVDHLVPISRGGSNNASNKALACKDCNNRKGDMTPEEFAANPKGKPKKKKRHNKPQGKCQKCGGMLAEAFAAYKAMMLEQNGQTVTLGSCSCGTPSILRKKLGKSWSNLFSRPSEPDKERWSQTAGVVK